MIIMMLIYNAPVFFLELLPWIRYQLITIGRLVMFDMLSVIICRLVILVWSAALSGYRGFSTYSSHRAVATVIIILQLFCHAIVIFLLHHLSYHRLICIIFIHLIFLFYYRLLLWNGGHSFHLRTTTCVCIWILNFFLPIRRLYWFDACFRCWTVVAHYYGCRCRLLCFCDRWLSNWLLFVILLKKTW